MQVHLAFAAVLAASAIAAPHSAQSPSVGARAVAPDSAVDLARLAPDVQRLRVEVDGSVLVARRVETTTTDGGFTWSGELESPDAGFASFAVADGEISGTVRADRELIVVRGRIGVGARAGHVDPESFATCAETEPIPRADVDAPLPVVAGPSTIDVMILYTPNARAAEGGTAAMDALVDLAISETNDAYGRSGVLQRVRLVARHEIAYAESSNVAVDLARMTVANDGWIDQVHALRDACGADAVALIVETSQSCGVANSLTNQGAGFAPYAFCVVARTCAAANLSLAHELGHVMGLAHDRDTSTLKCTRASVAGNSTQVLGPSTQPSTSRNGAYVAFTSTAGALVPGDTNGVADVFLRNRGLLTTTRVSVSTSGVEANAAPAGAPTTGDGGWIAWSSGATNLVANDANGALDVFLRDVGASTTTRVLPLGVEANGDCFEPSMSATDRFVAFTTRAANLGASATNTQVYRWDRLNGETLLVSASTSGQPGAGASGGAHVSDNGRYVAFWSAASDLVAGDTNGAVDVYVRDLQTSTTTRASVSTAGAQLALASESLTAISNDGRWIAFATASPDVVSGDANGTTDLYARDRVNGTTVLVSASTLGAPGNGPSSVGSAPAFTGDGTQIAFTSRASDLVAGDTNGSPDVFVRSLVLNVTERVSLSSSGAQIPGGTGANNPVDVDSSGRNVVFASTNPVAIDDTNNQSDVYVFDRFEPYPPGHSTYAYGYRTGDNAYRTVMAYAPGVRVPYFSNPNVSWQGRALGIASPSPFAAEAWRTLNDTASTVAGFRAPVTSAFCIGDGSGTACPCGNASAPIERAGCENSLGLAGRLVALGGASITGDTLVLRGSGMPNSSALYFQGTSQQAGGAGAVFGDGLRCVGGNVQRLGVRVNAANASSLPSNGSLPLSLAGGITAPTTVHYQVWYRNSAPYCSASTFNLTNGLTVAWQ